LSKLLLGTICGLIFGGIDVLLMIPLSFPTKPPLRSRLLIGSRLDL